MLILPIKKQWFDMIFSGKKKEEYREIKPYYTTRFINAGILDPDTLEPYNDSTISIMFRNGYSSNSPAFVVQASLKIKEGNPEWGAEPGVKYYTLVIENIISKQIINAA